MLLLPLVRAVGRSENPEGEGASNNSRSIKRSFCFHSCRNLRGGAPLTPGFDGPAVALSGAYSSVVVVTDVTHPYIRVGDGVSLSIYLKYNLYNEPLIWVCLFDLTNLSL